MQDENSKRKSSKGKSLAASDANSNEGDIEKDYTDTIERYRKSYNAQISMYHTQREKDKKMCTPSDRSVRGPAKSNATKSGGAHNIKQIDDMVSLEE